MVDTNSSQYLAFTTTYTRGSKTENLYLDIDTATTNLIALEYTPGKLPDSAYKFSVFKVTSPALPTTGIIPTQTEVTLAAEPKCKKQRME